MVPAMKNRTVEMSVKGMKVAQAIAGILIKESRWFTCDPLPEDEYAFEVHADASFLLRRLVNGDGPTWKFYGGYPGSVAPGTT